jgi:chromosome segregation ATPase
LILRTFSSKGGEGKLARGYTVSQEQYHKLEERILELEGELRERSMNVQPLENKIKELDRKLKETQMSLNQFNLLQILSQAGLLRNFKWSSPEIENLIQEMILLEIQKIQKS